MIHHVSFLSPRQQQDEWTGGALAGGSGKKSRKAKKGARTSRRAARKGQRGQRTQRACELGGAAQAKEDSPSPLDSQADEEPPEDDLDNECAICLLELEEEDEDEEGGLVLGCGHRFHAACVEQWVDRSNGLGMRATCPMCRADITY
jgi:hypothetical protein